MRTLLAVLALGLLPVMAEDERLLKDEAGNTVIRYVAEVPEGLTATADPLKQVGLFLCFPEHDRPTGDEILPVREALKRQGLLNQYIVIAGHPQGQKFGPADYEPIRKLIAWALKTYPINPRRVYMYGKGEGGKISGEFAMTHPELVTAAISYSWTWWKMPTETDRAVDPEKAAQFYMVLGLRDLSHHLTNVRDGYSRVHAKGYHVIYREFDELGARTYHPPSNDEAILWATALRNRTLPLSKAEQAAIATGRPAELAAVGDAAAVTKLFDSKLPATRAAAARLCQRLNLGEAAMAALAKLAVDPAEPVRREAIRALAVNANWRSATARQALIDLALAPGKAVTYFDRVDAVDGIVNAARFQVTGVRQDPALFRALVALAESKEDELRTMAANTLMPIRDPEFRGDIGRKERMAPEGGWAQWLDKVTALAAGYGKEYLSCSTATEKAAQLHCQAGELLYGKNANPAKGLALTKQAAELGYVPAQAMLGMLYAIAKGTEQNLPEAGKWWMKAAEAGHGLAATNASMVYRSATGGKGDPAVLKRLQEQAAAYAIASALP